MRLFPNNTRRARVRLVEAAAAFAAVALIAGCGDNFRPVITPITPSGPAPQTTAYAVVVSQPSPTTGIATIIDYSGDSVMAQAPIGPGPSVFTIDQGGFTAYTLNSDGTISNIPISTSLQQKQITYTTVPSTSRIVNLMAPSAGLWATDLSNDSVDLFQSSPQTFKLSIPVQVTPVFMAGTSKLTGQREYAVSDGFSDPTGMACNVAPTAAPAHGWATPIEIASNATDTPIPVGKCPVFGVQSPDLKRLFILNRGDDTITVINSQNNTLDQCAPFTNQNGQTVTCHPTLPLSVAALTPQNAPVNCNLATNPTCGLPPAAGPVYAEYNAATQQIIVSNYDGDTVNVVDVSLDLYGNDSSTFGTTYTIPVGSHPASVTALYDGSRAYTANQGDNSSPNGTVSVVNLVSHTLEKTLTVVGHPRTVVSTQNSLFGKVYVASPDSPYLTILQTTSDLVDTTVLIEGNVVDVRTTSSNGSSGSNMNYTSRVPGYGQPCNLPGIPAPAGTQTLLQACQAIP
jgi:DNA-binding beta-propeller fold protein YncE